MDSIGKIKREMFKEVLKYVTLDSKRLDPAIQSIAEKLMPLFQKSRDPRSQLLKN